MIRGWRDAHGRTAAALCLVALLGLLASPLAGPGRGGCGSCGGACCKAPGPAHRGCFLSPDCCGGSRDNVVVAPSILEAVLEDSPILHPPTAEDRGSALPTLRPAGTFAPAPPDPPPREAR